MENRLYACLRSHHFLYIYIYMYMSIFVYIYRERGIDLLLSRRSLARHASQLFEQWSISTVIDCLLLCARITLFAKLWNHSSIRMTCKQCLMISNGGCVTSGKCVRRAALAHLCRGVTLRSVTGETALIPIWWVVSPNYCSLVVSL